MFKNIKRYKLRWLFYRKHSWRLYPNKHYESAERCSNCKKGSSMYLLLSYPDSKAEFGLSFKRYCGRCIKEYIPEPNTNISHKFYKIYKKLNKTTSWILDKLHILRKSGETRYGIFGDESCLTLYTKWDGKTGETSYIKRPRKWWEYILIKK